MTLSGHNRFPRNVAKFTTTHWSVVLEAGNDETEAAKEALETLCQIYWYPVYAFVRRKGNRVEDAQDLTQGFFANILKKKSIQSADPAKGKFRTFLLGALCHFLTDGRIRANCLKRGGGCIIQSLDQTAEANYKREPAHDITAEKLYERQWALTLLDRTMERLRKECLEDGKANLFEQLAGALSGDPKDFSYKTASVRLGMSEGAMRTAVHRLRRRYAELLRHEIAQTVNSPDEVEEEVQYLFSAVKLS